MAIDFPASPTTGQTYFFGGTNYTFTAQGVWQAGGNLLYAPINNPVLTGDPQSVTPPPGDNDTSIATSAFLSNAVRADMVQSLNVNQQAQARSNVYASPFDALAYNGMQINGSMEVSQEVGTTTVAVNGTRKYIVDGWTVDTTGSQTLNGLQVSISPDGIATSLQVGVGPANASPASTDFAMIRGRLEGYRISRLMWGTTGASPMTVAFWVRATRPGNYSLAILNATPRSYVTLFTVNSTNTWEYKTITIPGDTAGSWSKDNTLGMDICFTMMAGSGRVGTANTWTSGVVLGVTGTINGVAATSDGMWITGVIVLPGIELPSAARSPLIMRPFDQELNICQRYYEKSYNYATAVGAAVGAGTNGIIQSVLPSGIIATPYQVMKRAIPTVLLYDGAGASSRLSLYTNAWLNGQGTSATTTMQKVMWFQAPAVGGAIYVGFDYTADARL